jgi:hypothetical protein
MLAFASTMAFMTMTAGVLNADEPNRLTLLDIEEILEVDYCKIEVFGRPKEAVSLVASSRDKTVATVPLELGRTGNGELLIWAKRKTGGFFTSGTNVKFNYVFRSSGMTTRGQLTFERFWPAKGQVYTWIAEASSFPQLSGGFYTGSQEALVLTNIFWHESDERSLSSMQSAERIGAIELRRGAK